MHKQSLPTRADMRVMDYRSQLVPLAKKHGVRANMKKEAIIDALEEVFKNIRHQYAARNRSIEKSSSSPETPGNRRAISNSKELTMNTLQQLNWNELRKTAKAYNVKVVGKREFILTELMEALNLRHTPSQTPTSSALINEPLNSGYTNPPNRPCQMSWCSSLDDSSRSNSIGDDSGNSNIAPKANEMRSPNFFKGLTNYSELQQHAKAYGINTGLKMEVMRSALIKKAEAFSKNVKQEINKSINVFIDMCPQAPDVDYDNVDNFHDSTPPMFDNNYGCDVSSDLFGSVTQRRHQENEAALSLNSDFNDDVVFKREPVSSDEELPQNDPTSSSPTASFENGSITQRSRCQSIHSYFDELGVSSIAPSPVSAQIAIQRLSETFVVKNSSNSPKSASLTPSSSNQSELGKSMLPVPLNFKTPKRRLKRVKKEYKSMINETKSATKHGDLKV